MYELINETNEKIEQMATIKELLDFIVAKEKLDNCLFNVILVDNNYIHKINKEYRGIDKETDVISFALEDNEQYYVAGMPRSLGDIFISYEHACQQAQEYGHSLKREMCFLMTHGLLHLLGYDHMNEDDEKEMLALQKDILNQLGIERG